MRSLFAAVAAVAVLASTADPDSFHVSHLANTPAALPELYVPHNGWRALKASEPVGRQLRHTFVGATEVGFVDYSCVEMPRRR